MAKTKIKFTYEDYKSLPESETKRYELLEGELVMVPSPTFEHQSISGGLFVALWDFVEEHGLGVVVGAPLDVVLGEDVVQPDILYVSKRRSRIITHEEIRGAPDLVVEILSPATAQRDRAYKKRLYARHGVKEYWIVDPDAKMIEVLSLGERGFESVGLYHANGTLSSPLLAGLKIALKEIF